MGSVISLHHLQRIDDMVERAKNTGSKILAGGERLFGRSEIGDFSFSKGAFYPPTVIADVAIQDEIWKEEVFGPVVVVKRFAVSVFKDKLLS
jgi:acyl-CoA reductase-like NAD-dependent aldehyde dehydrogenase